MSNPKHLADAEFSLDMVITLNDYFYQYCVDGIVTVEVTDRGLWLKKPEGGRQFLGSIRPISEISPRTLN